MEAVLGCTGNINGIPFEYSTILCINLFNGHRHPHLDDAESSQYIHLFLDPIYQSSQVF
jgi:hypothetical protein